MAMPATPELFRANGRVKQARIETSSGYSKTVTLKDNSEDQTIKLRRTSCPGFV